MILTVTQKGLIGVPFVNAILLKNGGINKMIRKHTRYTWDTPDDGELEVPWKFIEGSELFKISEDGLACVLGSLTQDESPQNPIEDWANGELIIFDRKNYRPDLEDWKRIVRANSGRIVPVDYFERVSGGTTIKCRQYLSSKDCRGVDSLAEKELASMDGYYVVPDDVPEPLEYATSVMRELTQYYQGDVYGVCVWTYTRTYSACDLNGNGIPGDYTAWSEPDRAQECWGYYGYKYAETELQAQFDATSFTQPANADNSKDQKELEL